ncbi:MAG: hypothetical protein EP330_01810 [Deltaproteobacteria bacterium]|nr:MAG: hypothetical protein EP330_01810 [Deltaproteobacteria bacterium]
MLRFFNVANAVTLVGLWSAVACALLAAGGKPAYAIVALIVAGIADFLDGAISRKLTRTEEEQRFGANLDSVADSCSFGMAPAVLFWSLGMQTVPDALAIGFFAACAVWRLAYFDTVGFGDGPSRTYTGLPTTFVALILPLALLGGFAAPDATVWIARVACVLLGAAMVSTVKVPKPGGAMYVVLPVLALIVGSTFALKAADFPVP